MRVYRGGLPPTWLVVIRVVVFFRFWGGRGGVQHGVGASIKGRFAPNWVVGIVVVVIAVVAVFFRCFSDVSFAARKMVVCGRVC